MFLEIELKLRIDPKHVELLFNHPLLRKANPTPPTEQLLSRYFDTTTLSLRQHKLSLRLREAESGTIQTLKTAGEQIGDLHHRHEWDQPIKKPLPNIHAFTDHTVSQKLQAIIGEQPLIEIFQTRFKRTQWNLSVEQSTEIELVLDQGTVNVAYAHTPLHEVELELKQGDVNQLYTVAEQLKQSIPLTLETRSKAERGYLLYNDNNLSVTDA
jgi:triphosphatase